MEHFDFVNRANAEYIDRLYQQYQSDPRSVESHWQAFFAGFEAGATRAAPLPAPGGAFAAAAGSAAAVDASAPSQQLLNLEIADLVHSYRELGHFVAQLDPLGHHRPSHPLLELGEFGLSLADLDRHVGKGGFLEQTDGTLRDLIEKLRITYCGHIGVEYMTIADKAQREWLQQRMEPILNHPAYPAEESKQILAQVVAAQGFEEFLHARYVGQKRFSLEGAEGLIPLLNTLVDDGAPLGVEEVVMGMAHRGRLNVLAHVLNKPYELIINEFEGTILRPDKEGDGDVKYHLGYSQDRSTPSGHKVHLALSFNPSHLELVNPVVEGIVRAKQYLHGDNERTRVVPILMHGDAAFCGQGIVQETLALSEMPYWRTGGTIHVIINNQIGFTTMPKQGRFTPYPTDAGKMIQAPIFHVNGDDPEAVVHVAKLAVAFRQQFKCDVMIDLWCYRRHGHNETDEPSFTQPLMYKEIGSHQALRELYAERLIAEGKVTREEYQQMKALARQRLDDAYAAVKEGKPKTGIVPFKGAWHGMERARGDWDARTQVPAELIAKIGQATAKVPAGFHVHPKNKRLLAARLEMSQGKLPVDWGCAEMFALGSLVLEGTPVRFVGQDAQRGTFGHRHACLHDYENGTKHYPLANLSETQAPIIFVNTMLSELAVVGFEYGFSSADPRNLVVWEAQFGDFVNMAQPMIDQFIVAAESKWQKMSGLVMLLPHGYEGAGPEHSSAYIERFLALCAENNIQVCQPSLPAQYFHLLRRQMLRKFRKPLILFMPKSLLRHEASTSVMGEFTDESFHAVLDDPRQPNRDQVRRVLACSGKIYFSLDAARLKHKVTDVAIVRVEQLYPFPQKELQGILSKYRHAQEMCWVQDEPMNRGAWNFMRDRLGQLLADNVVLTYYGRDEAASPATGSHKVHQIEEEEIITHALELSPAAARDEMKHPTDRPVVATPADAAAAPVTAK
jgi:2-oxoglutarate dehydrogenase E1 component